MTQVKLSSRDASGKAVTGKTIAIVGATGAVGGEMLKCVERSRMAVGRVKLFASERSAGRRLPFRGGEVELEVLSDNAFEGVDVALFASESDISKKYAPIAVQAGAVAIDNSSAFRMDP
jgi:aspartate-semialdehyde dehydrogenase